MKLIHRRFKSTAGIFRVGVLFALCFGFSGYPQTTAAGGQSDDIQKVMHSALESLTSLVEIALDPDVERDDGMRVEESLKQLERVTENLYRHGQLKPSSFHLVARSLDRNVQQMISSYRSGLVQVAELYLIDTIDHCVACHTHLSGIETGFSGKSFVEDIDPALLNTSLAAKILVAVREIPEAMKTWKEYLTDPQFNLSEVGAENELVEYLWQEIHLTGNIDGPLSVLSVLQENDNTPYYMRRKMKSWSEQLNSLSSIMNQQPGMDGIRLLIQKCNNGSSMFTPEQNQVCYMIVSRLAGKLLENNISLDPQENSELYYFLGLIRIRTEMTSSDVRVAELYLEAAIRESPDSMIAKTAYAELEEHTLNYSGAIVPYGDILAVPIIELRKIAGIK